jgi:hypothetical protein
MKWNPKHNAPKLPQKMGFGSSKMGPWQTHEEDFKVNQFAQTKKIGSAL